MRRSPKCHRLPARMSCERSLDLCLLGRRPEKTSPRSPQCPTRVLRLDLAEPSASSLLGNLDRVPTGMWRRTSRAQLMKYFSIARYVAEESAEGAHAKPRRFGSEYPPPEGWRDTPIENWSTVIAPPPK